MATATTVTISSPAVKHVFAVRQFIKVIALVCECGVKTHGRGVRKWRECPACGAHIISKKDQRLRDRRYPYDRVDQEIFNRYETGLPGGKP